MYLLIWPALLLARGGCIGITVRSATPAPLKFTSAKYAMQILNHTFTGIEKWRKHGGKNIQTSIILLSDFSIHYHT